MGLHMIGEFRNPVDKAGIETKLKVSKTSVSSFSGTETSPNSVKEL